VKNGVIDKVSFNDSLYENTGLYGEITWDDSGFYEGYPSYFIVNTIEGTTNVTNLDSLTNAVLPLAKKINASYTASTLNTSATIYHCQWTGYFKSDFTGTWKFSLNTLNFGMLWIGDTAITNDKSNVLLTDTGNGTASTQTINLINGKYYPIRITWGKRTSVTNPTFSLSFTRNATTITNLTSYLYSAKTNISTLVGIPTVFINKNANTIDNLYTSKLFAYYTDVGYHNNDLDYVQKNPIYNGSWSGSDYVANIGSITEASTTLGFAIVHNLYSILYTGYFKADFTGTFTFNLNTDDETYLWIGDYAISGYTTSNRLVYSYVGSNGSGSISLTNGQYYPIRILYGQNTSSAYCNLSFTRNDQTITDWTGYTFHPITPAAGYPRMFIDDIIVIGAYSPISSYFTNYIINVPTMASFNTYAGNYIVTSSSIYSTTSFLTYNLFKGDNTLSGTEYTTFWSCANQSAAYSFKPITNTVLNYTQSPYNAASGIYVGGGNASLTYSTTYYTTGSATAIASGEWVQIMVPYNMKLTSYSNRARYTNSRIPIQYVILGSTDGSSNWYALDEVDIVTQTSYVPLKKYIINTNTYPYAKNYYNFFRYVIKKIDTPSGGDKIMANENQWNLVGIKETPTANVGKTIYIGANSPSGFTSYFTSNSVTVPSSFSSPEYIGSYAIAESSAASTIAIGVNLFRNDSNNDGTSYGTIWHCGYTGSSNIDGAGVTYTRQPYNTNNGIYQGTPTYYFTTPYYTSANSTYNSTGFVGEWVQIKLPFKLKMTGYSHRTRYINIATLGRNPSYYRIFGSNDGTVWFIVDEQTSATTTLNTININTSTYPDGKYGYCYFRWVIQNITGGSQDVVNENQWNLIGTRIT